MPKSDSNSTSPLTKEELKFRPSRIISAAGVLSSTDEAELLPDLLKEGHGSSSHLIVQKDDAEPILYMLENAFFQATRYAPLQQTDEEESEVSNYYDVKFTKDSEVSIFQAALAAARHRISKQAHKELSKGAKARRLSACILTTLQVENFSSKEALRAARSSRSGYPSKVEFTLIRTLARPKLVGPGEKPDSLGTLSVATNSISKLKYVLTYFPATKTFKLLYSSSLCSVTDSIASKYMGVTDQRAMLDLLSRMFTLPLLELNRIAKKKTRERVDNSILKEFEYILNDYMLPNPVAGRIPFASYGWKAIAKDPGLESEEKRAVLSRIRIASLILSTHLQLLLKQMATSENRESELIRSLLSCIRYVFKEELTLPDGYIVLNNKQTRVKEKDIGQSARESLSDDADALSAGFRLGSVRLEIFNSASVQRRKLYELEFKGFDMASIEKELMVSKDEGLHSNNSISTDEEDYSEEPVHKQLDLSSDIGVQLFITSGALNSQWGSDSSGLNARVVPRSSALELLNFVELNGGMHNAFLEDFTRAWERSRLGYWLRPRNWTYPISGESNFAKVARRVHDSLELIPSYATHNQETLDYVINLARELYSTPRSELPALEGRLRKCQKLFPLEKIAGNNKNYSVGIKNPHSLAILILAYMNVRRDLVIQDVLKEAPFVPDELKKRFNLSDWRASGRGYQKRDPFVRMLSVLSMKILGFDPRWPVGLHENIFRRFHASFFHDSNGGVPLTTLLDTWNANAPALLPQFASGFRELSNVRIPVKSPATKK